MTVVHATVGSLVLGLNLSAGLWGAWCWWQGRSSPIFWPLLRAGQGILVVQILLGGALIVLGHRPAELHILYGVLPLVVAFFGEQLRLSSAESILSAKGVAREEARSLPEVEQDAIVASVLRREMGVMALSALIVFALAFRAAQSAGYF